MIRRLAKHADVITEIFGCALAGVYAQSSVRALVDGDILWGGFSVAMLFWSLTIAGRAHERRRTTRDHRDPRTGDGAGDDALITGTVGTGTSAGIAAAGPGARTSVNLRHQEGPIRAWKIAWVALTSDGWRFRSMYQSDFHYDASEVVAACSRLAHSAHGAHGHGDVPSVDCSCGLYAAPTPDEAAPNLGDALRSVVLEVELYGRVVAHERGYRASRMRVMSATLDRRALDAHEQLVECNWLGTIRRVLVTIPAINPDDLRRDLPTDWRFE